MMSKRDHELFRGKANENKGPILTFWPMGRVYGVPSGVEGNVNAGAGFPMRELDMAERW